MSKPGSVESAGPVKALGPGLRDGLLIASIALIGGVISVLGYRSLRQAEALRRDEILGAAVETVLSSVELELTRAVEAARSGGLMLELQTQLQRSDFNRFAQGLTRQLPSVRVLEWQPMVPADERAEFEAAARAQGLPGYRIVEPQTGAQAHLHRHRGGP